MWWVVFIVCQAAVILTSIRNEKRTGLWSGSKFVFSLGFAALELVILWAPLYLIDANSSWFVRAMTAAGILAALDFIWFIIVSRRWKLPDGRTSLQAYRDEHPDK